MSDYTREAEMALELVKVRSANNKLASQVESAREQYLDLLSEYNTLSANHSRTVERLYHAEGVRDALAAHVEAMHQLFENKRKMHPTTWAVRGAELMQERPSTSLARQKLLWQAEALDQLLPAVCDVADRAEVRNLRDELRRQAEETTP